MTWQQEAERLAASVEAITSVTPRETDLTDRLVQFTYEPVNGGAASIGIMVSESEVIFEAGRGTRFELDDPRSSTAEIEALTRAVVAGRLHENVKRRSIRFRLELEDGTERTGRVAYLARVPEPHGVVDYAPYRASSGP